MERSYQIETVATGSGALAAHFSATSDTTDPDGANNDAGLMVTVASQVEIPALDGMGLWMLCLLLGCAALWTLKRSGH